MKEGKQVMCFRKLFSKVILFLFISLICSCNIVIFAKNITKATKICDLFKDLQLSRIVANSLKKSSEADLVTQSELNSIIILNASKNRNAIPICRLEGIEYLNNLEQLLLGGNNITDVSALASLSKLWELHLLYNVNLEDISPLKNLANIERLNLTNTAVKDISSLSNMKNLNWICLQGTHIDNYSVLYKLPNLEVCDIYEPLPNKNLDHRCVIM